MKEIPVRDAVGHIVPHDMTRIVIGEDDRFKGPAFKKGHVITKSDIELLLSMGKEHIYAMELEAGMLHENDAAVRLLALCENEHMNKSDISEGKIELSAAADGLFLVDIVRLDAINAVDGIIIATRRSGSAVMGGDKLAGMRVIPMAIGESVVAQAEEAACGTPIMRLMPYVNKSAAIITTGGEVYKGIIKDTFTEVVEGKLISYGADIVYKTLVPDDELLIISSINKARESGAKIILLTGGMSVDPDDRTPGAIKKSGANIVTYGAPVLPGAMFLYGYYEDGTVVMGLPGCVMYAKATIFDYALPYALAGVRLTKMDFSRMGNGGLCLCCDNCAYPICPFCK